LFASESCQVAFLLLLDRLGSLIEKAPCSSL
jgi:hypothetical protein